jgi:hypothetical protein
LAQVARVAVKSLVVEQTGLTLCFLASLQQVAEGVTGLTRKMLGTAVRAAAQEDICLVLRTLALVQPTKDLLAVMAQLMARHIRQLVVVAVLVR